MMTRKTKSWVSLGEIEMTQLTPSPAIRLECRACMGMTKVVCDNKTCKLNDKSLTPLRRIKLHCLDCVGTKKGVKECTGKLLSDSRLCYLYPYRIGHNPKQTGIGNPRFTKNPKEMCVCVI